jgi:cytochrome d ubiquinol oxidase subunit II
MLPNIWFVIVAVFWVGFFILEGFDFGVGMLHSFVGRNELEKRIAVNSIGPVWDGNEVWLVVAGAATFAAFPGWYATMFSTFYLAMVLILVALIIRGMSFEFRGKIKDPRWRAAWQWSLTIGSALIPLLLGTALGDLLYGLPINSAGDYTGTFLGLLVPFGLYTGVTLTILCLFLGATYLTLKTLGELRERMAKLSGRLGWLAAVAVLGWVTWSHLGLNEGFVPKPIDALALVAVAAGAWFAESRAEGAAFTSGAVAIGSVVASIFFDLFPQVMVSSTNALYSLTVADSASPDYTLKVMTVVAVLFTPVVLAYQAWSLWIFRKRLGAAPSAVSAESVPTEPVPTEPVPTEPVPTESVSNKSAPTESLSTTTKEIT